MELNYTYHYSDIAYSDTILLPEPNPARIKWNMMKALLMGRIEEGCVY